MENAANKVASMLKGMPANYNVFVGTVMAGAIDTVKETIDSDVIIINQWGRVVQSTLGDRPVSLPDTAIDTVFSGEIYRQQAVLIE